MEKRKKGNWLTRRLCRLLDEKRMVDLLSRAHELQEDVYATRWNPALDKATKAKQVLEKKRILIALEREIRALRVSAVKSFDDSLALESLGLGPAELYGAERDEAGDRGEGLDPYDQMSRSIAHASELAEDEDLENLKMLRVASAEVVKDMKPGEKFAHLYDLYDSSKNDGSNRHAHMAEEERIKLRGQIYALKQRTNLSQKDRVLLSELQARLKAAK